MKEKNTNTYLVKCKFIVLQEFPFMSRKPIDGESKGL